MSLSDKRTLSAPGYNAEELVVIEYDFAEDGGATGDYDIIENGGTDNMLIELDHIHAETAVTSAGDPTLDIGKGDGGTEIASDILKAELAADSIVLPDTAGTKIVLANGEKCVLGIEVAAITAGKFHMTFKIQRAKFDT